ncbi:hypothetical protein [Parasutterella sp.]|uniref:hypothetical protein n=1 Tax=Parasutterella sp. TaxID=2049037 RepID=UPI003AAF0E74
MRTTLSSRSSYPQFAEPNYGYLLKKATTGKSDQGKVVPEQLFLKIRSGISFSIPTLSAMLKRGKLRQHGLLPDFSKDKASLFARG